MGLGTQGFDKYMERGRRKLIEGGPGQFRSTEAGGLLQEGCTGNAGAIQLPLESVIPGPWECDASPVLTEG